MRGSIGQLLIAQGAIDAGALSDALARQSGRHPLASELYTLGYCSERQLATALSVQTGWPAIVLDESTIRLDVLEHVSLEWARIFSALVVYEDDRSIVVAAARPEDAIVPARELGSARGKNVELRIALDITLARTIRIGFSKWKRGETYLIGPECDRKKTAAYLAIVQPDSSEGDEHRQAQRALAEDAARNIEDDDELPDHPSSSTLTGDWQVSTITTTNDDEQNPILEERTQIITADLDRGTEEITLTGSGGVRALVVDPDPPGRLQMMAELEKLGWECSIASNGGQAVDLLSQQVFELVFADVGTPDIDGLQLCRAIKRSRRLARTRVVITTSVVDSGQVSDEVLQRHAADGYIEKPIDPRKLHRMLRELTPSEGDRADQHEGVLADALGRYHNGDIEGAIAKLRDALVTDPASPKLHFMLANMLQRASRWAEAVDHYEAVVELQPAYFPALTRLAYLYFRQGLHARAVETWRRALPVCDDPALRRNIELFMRKLVADMAKSEAG
ncbi:MAG: response regulator [Deltaproteobacteria bacterium]|nr:response regulator [Deltaproteobacteria bacterium]